jgi:tetratricopeptide (TPR) repeat protein
MTSLSFLLALAIGWLLVRRFDPLKDLASGPRWARSLFRISLALIAGLGFTSLSFLLQRMAGVSRPLWFVSVDVVCVAIMALIRQPPTRVEDRTGTNWIALAPLAAMLIPSGIRVVQMASANPTGQWDAWAIWNKHAKFLAASDSWRDAASPLLGATHPEYPMLLPSIVARVWLMSGDTANAVPILIGLLFFAALVGLFVSALAILKGTAAAALGGIILLSLQPLLYWAASQYADVPLACLMTATLALIFIGSPAALVWAGFCVGMAAWTKQEGGPFAGAVILAFLVWQPRRSWRLLAGAAPLLLLALWFTLRIAPPGIFAPRPLAAELALLTDSNRYAIIGRALIDHLPGYPLILVALLAVTLRIERDRARAAAIWTAATALLLMLASYLAAYLVTPLDLNWHIANSMDRLIVQIWPAMLLTLCGLLPPDLDRTLFAVPSFSRGWAWAGAAAVAAGLLIYPFIRRSQEPLPPGTPEDYLNESLKDFQSGQYAPSIAAAQKALRLRPEYAQAWNNIAVSDVAMGRFDEAIGAAQHALRINPDFQLAKNNLVWAISEKNKTAAKGK